MTDTRKEQIKDLERRLTSIVLTTCNVVGCKDCGLKFGGFDSQECSATDLQGRILDMEMADD